MKTFELIYLDKQTGLEDSYIAESLDDALDEARLLYSYCGTLAIPLKIIHDGNVIMDKEKILNWIELNNE